MTFWLSFICILWINPLTLSKSDLLGKIDPAQDDRFIKPADVYTKGSARTQYLRKETYEAFILMQKAAKKEGIHLVICSATRTFSMQKQIWERKWQSPENAHFNTKERALHILHYSSMPGTSRHHWGTDIDINELNNAYFETGKGQKEYTWLKNNAEKFGFCQTYTSKKIGSRKGYEEEKWHWSYMPLSRVYLEQYQKNIRPSDIAGFLGEEVVTALPILEEYVQGIACL